MTRYINPRNSTRDRVNRRARQLEAEGRIQRRVLRGPSRPFKLTPGFAPVYVNMRAPDGTSRDTDAARAFLAERPYAALLVYRGVARERHVFEYDPRGMR